MSRLEIKGKSVSLKPVFIAIVGGITLAVLAVVFQDGEARGYASVGFLFLTAGLMALSVLTSIVLMAIGRLHVALDIFAFGVILLTAYVCLMLTIQGLT